MNIFVFGSSIVSSYWNGAATYYRGIYKHLARRGHRITFAEPDAYGRQQHRDAGDFSYVESAVYQPETDVDRMLQQAAASDLVIKHSGIGVDDQLLEQRVADLASHMPAFFWDVDSPATLARMHCKPGDPFGRAIPRYTGILSYGGGPASRMGYLALGAKSYCAIMNGLDPETHHPVAPDPAFMSDLAFIGNRLPDREERVKELFFEAARLAPDRTFLLGGEGWGGMPLPTNVRRIGHVPTADHNRINSSARMVMNINRESMARSGFSPPTRVFEVAGAGACMLCDRWPGIDECFDPGREILVIDNAQDVVELLRRLTESDCHEIGAAFRARALRDHTYAQRAEQAEAAFLQVIAEKCEQTEEARA